MGRSGVTMGSEAEWKVWLLGGLKTSVDNGSMLGAGESSRFCIWDVPVGGAPIKVSSGCGLSSTLGCAVGEENVVSGEAARDSVGAAGVEEG